jgi:hypothetical protein
MVSRRGSARIAFPVVGGWGISDAAVEGLTVEGNRAKRGGLDGCRGGEIYLFDCADVAIRDCAERDYHGDGISLQVSLNAGGSSRGRSRSLSATAPTGTMDKSVS